MPVFGLPRSCACVHSPSRCRRVAAARCDGAGEDRVRNFRTLFLVADLTNWVNGNFCGNWVRKFRPRGLQPVKPKQKTSSSSNNRRPDEAEKPQIRQGSPKTRSTPTNRWKRYPLRPSRCGAAESPCAPPPQRRGGGAFLPRRVPSCAPGAWPDRPWRDRPFSWGPFP